MESEMTELIFGQGTAVSALSADKNFDLCVVSLRISGPSKKKRDRWDNLAALAEAMMKSYCNLTGLAPYPDKVHDAASLLDRLNAREPSWIEHNEESRSSTTVPFQLNSDIQLTGMYS